MGEPWVPPCRTARSRSSWKRSAILSGTTFPRLEKWARGAHFLRKKPDLTQVHEKERQLHREVADTVESRIPDLEVLAVELGGPEHITVYVDHPSGVDHALCERVTNELRPYLESYRVDVSSPGFERPLRTREHFEVAVGRRAALRTDVEVAGRKRFRGEIVDAGERGATISVGDERVEVPYEAIVRGNLIEEGR
jgi:ribosome maturation factor RimP